MNKRAFTLVEILVVLSIIAIIGAFAIVRMRGAISSANDTEKKVNLNSIKKALFLYGIEHTNTYPIETGCNIGSCTNLDTALTNVLPDSVNGTYTYTSDGTEFTLSTVLSSGYAYTYDSETNAYTTQEPVNGICGSANQTYTYDSTSYGSDTFCQSGTSTPSSPSFPEIGSSTSWTCPGTNGGSAASCSASRNNTPINGACGSSNGQNLSSIPETNLCTTGTATTVSGEGPWTWSCSGQYGGTTSSCSTAGLPVNGSCGTANQTYAYSVTSYGSDTYCSTGSTNPVSPSFPAQGSTTSWTCDGLNTGTTANCSASRNNAPVNGSCGTKNGKYASTTPSGTQACATGTVSGMTGSYSWTCAGQYGGTSSGTCATVAATYTVQSFTTVGTTSWTVPSEVTSVEYLVVGGGGSGGGYWGGGGGAGAYRTGTLTDLSGSLTVTVGAGSVACTGIDCDGTAAGDSVFATITSSGGGNGGNAYTSGSGGVGKNGGSGGGGNGQNNSAGGSPVSGQGYAGGAGYANGGAGGGGGAGGTGSNGVSGSNIGGNGGDGVSNSITGTAVIYAAGGGGAESNTSGTGTGGVGGSSGVGGSAVASSNGLPGTANTGSGGGGGHGGSDFSHKGGNGGSGIVVVKYINNY